MGGWLCRRSSHSCGRCSVSKTGTQRGRKTRQVTANGIPPGLGCSQGNVLAATVKFAATWPGLVTRGGASMRDGQTRPGQRRTKTRQRLGALGDGRGLTAGDFVAAMCRRSTRGTSKRGNRTGRGERVVDKSGVAHGARHRTIRPQQRPIPASPTPLLLRPVDTYRTSTPQQRFHQPRPRTHLKPSRPQRHPQKPNPSYPDTSATPHQRKPPQHTDPRPNGRWHLGIATRLRWKWVQGSDWRFIITGTQPRDIVRAIEPSISAFFPKCCGPILELRDRWEFDCSQRQLRSDRSRRFRDHVRESRLESAIVVTLPAKSSATPPSSAS